MMTVLIIIYQQNSGNEMKPSVLGSLSTKQTKKLFRRDVSDKGFVKIREIKANDFFKDDDRSIISPILY